MTSQKNSMQTIPFRTLNIIFAVCSAVIPFTKWFSVDIAGLASLLSVDTSFSIFDLRNVIEMIYGQVPAVYNIILLLFVAMAGLQAIAAILWIIKHQYAGLVSRIACTYSIALSAVAIVFCFYVSSEVQYFALNSTLFPFLAVALAVAELVCVVYEEKRPFLTKDQVISLILLVAGAVVWGLIVRIAHTNFIGDIVLFLAVFQYWVIFLGFRATNK